MPLSEVKLLVLGRPGFIFEVKWDGFRFIAGVAQGKIQLRSRGGADYTRAFPEIVASLAQLGDGPHIPDGEVVVLDDQGRSEDWIKVKRPEQFPLSASSGEQKEPR